jgi:ribosomal protein S18 acetylase RimI-like enzyme
MPAALAYRLRPAEPADEAFLSQLYADAHIDEFLPMRLPDADLKALLRMQFRAQRMGYARDFADAIDRIALAAEPSARPIGRLLVATRRDAIHLVDIALVPEARGRGVGTALLGELLENARRQGLPVRLQVRPGNPAFHLYSRLGFQVIRGGMNLEMEFLPGTEPARRNLAAHPGESLPEAHPIEQQWSSLRGRSFRVMEVSGGAFPPLVLASLERVVFGASAAYSLIFHGPPERFLPQATYSLRLCDEHTHEPVEGDDRLLFLVPIGPAQGVMRYEAVFN